MLKPNKLTRLVHKIENQHLKISKGHRITGSVDDATPKQLHKIRELVKQEDELDKKRRHDSHQLKLF